MRKKPWAPLIVLVAVAALLALFVLASHQPWLTEHPTYQLLNGLLKTSTGEQAILASRLNSRPPYSLTNNQRYSQALAPTNAVNVLLVGPDVSGSNWDSLLVASLDTTHGTIRLINIPRDLRIEYSGDVLELLSVASPNTVRSVPARKINAAHIIGRRIGYREDSLRFGTSGLDFTADLIGEIFNLRIDDVVLVKPDGFRRIVDRFGGVDIEVPYRMNYRDPTQDLVIDLQKGYQHLDGSQSEGFVRFRQGIDEDGKYRNLGDAERKKNQNDFFRAFVVQHLTPSNLDQFGQIAGELDRFMETSVIEADRLASYTKMAGALIVQEPKFLNMDISVENERIDGIWFVKLTEPVPEPAAESE